MSGLMDAMQIDPTIVGDRDDTEWKIFAKVDPAFQLEPLDGALPKSLGRYAGSSPYGDWRATPQSARIEFRLAGAAAGAGTRSPGDGRAEEFRGRSRYRA